MVTEERTCESTRYAARKPCTPDGPKFDVVVTTTTGVEADRHPACFTHGLAEVDRHYASAGIARCELVPAPAPAPEQGAKQ